MSPEKTKIRLVGLVPCRSTRDASAREWEGFAVALLAAISLIAGTGRVAEAVPITQPGHAVEKTAAEVSPEGDAPERGLADPCLPLKV